MKIKIVCCSFVTVFNNDFFQAISAKRGFPVAHQYTKLED